MATVDEHVKGELSRRLRIDYQVPRAGDSGPEIGIFFAATVERAASKRAIVLCAGVAGNELTELARTSRTRMNLLVVAKRRGDMRRS